MSENYTKIREKMRAVARKRRLNLEKAWATQEIVALKITLDEPAPDGEFEIIFETRSKAEEWLAKGEHLGQCEIISAEQGLTLVQSNNCSGGPFEFKRFKDMQKYSPQLQALEL